MLDYAPTFSLAFWLVYGMRVYQTGRDSMRKFTRTQCCHARWCPKLVSGRDAMRMVFQWQSMNTESDLLELRIEPTTSGWVAVYKCLVPIRLKRLRTNLAI